MEREKTFEELIEGARNTFESSATRAIELRDEVKKALDKGLSSEEVNRIREECDKAEKDAHGALDVLLMYVPAEVSYNRDIVKSGRETPRKVKLALE